MDFLSKTQDPDFCRGPVLFGYRLLDIIANSGLNNFLLDHFSLLNDRF